MNEIIKKILEGNKFMSEMHLRLPGFIYCACGSFYKTKKRTKKFKETGNSRYIYQNQLDKVCFQHDMADEDFQNVRSRKASNKVLCDKAFNIAKKKKYDEYQHKRASVVYKCFDKKSLGANTSGGAVTYANKSDINKETLSKRQF